MHLRSNPCQILAPQPIEGIDQEALTCLRKRSPALRLEEDKWRNTYQILFRSVLDADIPSPYYDYDSPTEESRRFRRELLSRIRRELFNVAEQENSEVEENLLRQVADIIRRCETELLEYLVPVPDTSSTSLRGTPSSQVGQGSDTAFGPTEGHTLIQHPPQSLTPELPAIILAELELHNAVMFLVTEQLESAAEPLTPRHLTQAKAQNLNTALEDPFQITLTPSEWIDWQAVFPSLGEPSGGATSPATVGT